MPGKPFQSKLLPHLAFIRERRARRWSYVRIAAALREEHGLSVAPSEADNLSRIAGALLFTRRSDAFRRFDCTDLWSTCRRQQVPKTLGVGWPYQLPVVRKHHGRAISHLERQRCRVLMLCQPR